MSTPGDRYSRTPHQDDQYTRQQQAAGGGPPGPYDPDLEPATQGEVRTLRRWIIVTAIWAVAASAIGLIALLADDGGNGDGEDETTVIDENDTSNRSVVRNQRRLQTRIERIEERTEDAPSSDDLSELNGRIDGVEESIEGLDEGASPDDIQDLNGRIDELESRVEELESQPPPEEAP